VALDCKTIHSKKMHGVLVENRDSLKCDCVEK
jgi:hypothetical protein